MLNGIDTKLYNPADDKIIYQTYSMEDLSGKAKNKEALQKDLALEPNADMPAESRLIGRLTNQKGLDLVDCVLGEIMAEDIQLAILGMGTPATNLFSERKPVPRPACRALCHA